MNTSEHKPDASTRQKAKKKQPKRVKAGHSIASFKARQKLFVRAYLANGRNATQAAVAAGYSKARANDTGYKLLKLPEVQVLVADAVAEVEKITGLDAERTLLEVARIAYGDPRRLYHADGTPKSMQELGDSEAAMLASVETDVITKYNKVIGHTTKLKTWDKNAALEKAMRFHGLYERDNVQRAPSLALQVVMVGPP